MCGIVGFMDKRTEAEAPVGKILLSLLTALGRRGPDSAGAALYGGAAGLVAWVKLDAAGDLTPRAAAVAERARSVARMTASERHGHCLRLVVEGIDTPRAFEAAVEGVHPEIEVISLGRRLQIVKALGAPVNLEAIYGLSSFSGTHGLGHTRLSTESRVDLSHSQPFWAHGTPDLAVVHNGHITNYHKLRRRYEQRGGPLLHRERFGGDRRLPLRADGRRPAAQRSAPGVRGGSRRQLLLSRGYRRRPSGTPRILSVSSR